MGYRKNNILQNIKCLFYKKNGATALEFALVAPVFFILLLGTIELGLILFAESMLQGSLTHGARIGKTGYSEGNREAYIKSEIIRLSGFILDPDELVVEALNYNNYANIGQIEPCIPANVDPCPGSQPNLHFQDINGNGIRDDQGISGAGIRERTVLYEARYKWPMVTPFMRDIFGDTNGDYVFSSRTVVVNEAF